MSSELWSVVTRMLSLTDIDDIDLDLTADRQRGCGTGRTAVEDAVDEIHRLLCKGSVNANQVAAEGKNAQYNSDDSKDGDRPFGKGGIGFAFCVVLPW